MNNDAPLRALRRPELDRVTDVELDRLVTRLESEQAARAGSRGTRRGGGRRHVRRALIALAMLAILTTGTALAAGTNPVDWVKRTWFPHAAVDSVAATDDVSLQTLNAAERRTLRQMLDGMPADRGNLGPLQSEMKPVGDGRVLVDGADGRVSALASKRGDVCIVWSKPAASRASGGTCVGEFPESGVAVVAGYDGNVAEIPGLFADDVSTITIETRDGAVHDVELGANGFIWRSDASIGDGPVSMRIIRAGITYDIKLGDPRPASSPSTTP
jgi:hypothetical protein